MASITIRNLDVSIKEKLRLRAAAHGRSMEEEVRLILGELGNAIPMATPAMSTTIRASGSLSGRRSL